MNASFFSLRVSYVLNSPLFTTYKSYYTKCRFKNIFSSHFSSNFINSENPNFNFHSSTFKNYLNTAIKINSDHKYNGIVHQNKFFKHSRDFSAEYHTILVKCSFINIKNHKKGAAGGAIYYSVKDGLFDIKNCLFQWCFALQRSGAFLISSKLMSATSMCIMECSSGRSVQAFTVTTYHNRARANITNSIITKCGPKDFNTEKDQLRIETVSLDFTNTNVTKNRRLNIGCIYLFNLYDAAINYCDFCNNLGPNMFSVHNSFDVYLAYSNVRCNNLGDRSIIESIESSVYITFTFFRDNINVCENATFNVESDSGTKVIFGNCTFDMPKDNITYNNNLVQFRKSFYGITSDDLYTFQMERECKFYTYPSRTLPKRTPVKKKIYFQDYVPEPTIDWYPKSLGIHQGFLYIVICTTFPILAYAFITKKKRMEIYALERN